MESSSAPRQCSGERASIDSEVHLQAEANGSPCSFFEKRGLHGQGFWKHECQCVHVFSVFDRDSSWHLPKCLSPCRDPEDFLTKPLQSWSEYFNWRRLPFESTAAILLHWPLTLYFALCQGSFEGRESLNIHYLGPERELGQLQIFGELLALLPNTNVHIDFIGPAVPSPRHQSTLKLNCYAKCLDSDCECKELNRTRTGSTLTVSFWKGLYHKLHEKLGRPDLIFAPNAGIPAFRTWKPTIELLMKLKIPVFFTDYCEEACAVAVECIDSVSSSSKVTFPITANPFKQPFVPWQKTLDVPMYSNGFIFGLEFVDE